MFSSRTNWDLRPNKLSKLLQEKRERGEQIIDLTESNPTRCGFIYDPRLTLESLSTRRSMTYEPDPKGILSARLAVAEHYSSQGIDLHPDHILLTASTSEGYSFLFRLLCEAGDQVLFPKPSYPLFEHLAQLNDLEPLCYRLQYDGEWRVDLSSIEEFLSPRTRAIVLVHPNNPTGSYITQDEWGKLEQLAAHTNCAIIVDEVFTSFEWSENAHHVKSFARQSNVLTFTLNGLSKLAGLPQMKLAWLTVSGPSPVASQAIDRLEMISDTYLSVGTPAQQALPLLLQNAGHIGDQIRERVRSSLQVLQSQLRPPAPLSLLHGEGGWSAIVRIPNTRSDEAWAFELLSSHNVLVHPGYLFGFDKGEFLVLSLLPKTDVLKSALPLIVDVVARTSSDI